MCRSCKLPHKMLCRLWMPPGNLSESPHMLFLFAPASQKAVPSYIETRSHLDKPGKPPPVFKHCYVCSSKTAGCVQPTADGLLQGVTEGCQDLHSGVLAVYKLCLELAIACHLPGMIKDCSFPPHAIEQTRHCIMHHDMGQTCCTSAAQDHIEGSRHAAVS